jgi:hypothetical protein
MFWINLFSIFVIFVINRIQRSYIR